MRVTQRLSKAGFVLAMLMMSFSCREKGIKDVLVVDCYWDIIEKNSPYPLHSCYKFDAEGNANFYYYHFFREIRTDSIFRAIEGDANPNTWKSVDDSLLIRGTMFNVLRFNDDSVFLVNDSDTTILHKNCKLVLTGDFQQIGKL